MTAHLLCTVTHHMLICINTFLIILATLVFVIIDCKLICTEKIPDPNFSNKERSWTKKRHEFASSTSKWFVWHAIHKDMGDIWKILANRLGWNRSLEWWDFSRWKCYSGRIWQSDAWASQRENVNSKTTTATYPHGPIGTMTAPKTTIKTFLPLSQNSPDISSGNKFP